MHVCRHAGRLQEGLYICMQLHAGHAWRVHVCAHARSLHVSMQLHAGMHAMRHGAIACMQSACMHACAYHVHASCACMHMQAVHAPARTHVHDKYTAVVHA